MGTGQNLIGGQQNKRNANLKDKGVTILLPSYFVPDDLYLFRLTLIQLLGGHNLVMSHGLYY
jgi:hypothetical protein